MQRPRFFWRAFKRGLPSLWQAIGVLGALVGGSILGYVVFAWDEPWPAAAILVLALVLTVGEGAFRLHEDVERERDGAQRQLRHYERDRPRLSFGRAEVPERNQAIYLRSAEGYRQRIADGRIVRVPITNALGAAEAKQVHARLRFDTPGSTTLASGFVPKPTQAEWVGEHGPELEVDLPGNGRPRLLDVVVILDRTYPNVFEWTERSRAAGLNGYEMNAYPFEVEIEVMGSGPGSSAPRLADTLEIECRPGILRADWLSRSDDEATNMVPWTTRTPPSPPGV